MKILDEQLKSQILRQVPRDLQKQLYLPEDVDVSNLLDNLLIQVYYAFAALMEQPKSAYSGQARRWMGCYNRLAKTYYLLRELMVQGAPAGAFDLRIELEMDQGISEWLEDHRFRPAA